MLGKSNQIETRRTDATNGGSQRNALPDEISKQTKENEMMKLVVGVHVALFILWCLIVLLFSLEV